MNIFNRIAAALGVGSSGRNTNRILERIQQLETKIMATQAEAAATLNEVLAQQQKTATEIQGVQASVDILNAKIVELEAVIVAGSVVSPELDAAVAAVKAQAQLTDDLIPDAAPPVTPE